jgi:hypothetical protein
MQISPIVSFMKIFESQLLAITLAILNHTDISYQKCLMHVLLGSYTVIVYTSGKCVNCGADLLIGLGRMKPQDNSPSTHCRWGFRANQLMFPHTHHE